MCFLQADKEQQRLKQQAKYQADQFKADARQAAEDLAAATSGLEEATAELEEERDISGKLQVYSQAAPFPSAAAEAL